LIIVAGSVAVAQDEPRDPRPDVLVLDNGRATEPACFDGSFRASGVCMAIRAEKADRWLQAIVKSCVAMAIEDDRRKKEAFRGWPLVDDYAPLLRNSQQAFESYRTLDSQAAYAATYPGRLAAANRWYRYFRLTVERATSLLGDVGLAPSQEVDLTKTDWCG
jgi:hypothetical protein